MPLKCITWLATKSLHQDDMHKYVFEKVLLQVDISCFWFCETSCVWILSKGVRVVLQTVTFKCARCCSSCNFTINRIIAADAEWARKIKICWRMYMITGNTEMHCFSHRNFFYRKLVFACNLNQICKNISIFFNLNLSLAPER